VESFEEEFPLPETQLQNHTKKRKVLVKPVMKSTERNRKIGHSTEIQSQDKN
jgi:hypothetical protein